MLTVRHDDHDDHGDAPGGRGTARPVRGAALLAGAFAALTLLTACGTDGGQAAAPDTGSRAATPSPGDTGTDTASGDGRAGPAAGSAEEAASSSASSASAAGAGSGTRCHTSELRASVGPNHPGAGQENFALVLTNTSGHTCTLHGYPGAAFVDGHGKQLGADPKRSSDQARTVTLKPGATASAGLTFSNPEVSGARTATPAALLVTPPDERDALKVTWTHGEVPVSGNASSVRLTVVRAGSTA
ncbi:DUF4232 domain-containing protein [Streptomyces sp. NPDC008313]|uniref:DUF4232 domain-containing protein n=1 Tax=Streptomyces sp. NPDC008313 TaxID=3364826 RepID=UPI0036ECBEE1